MGSAARSSRSRSRSRSGDRRRKNTKKLLVGERIEVRSKDEGLEGSWHSAVVVKECFKTRRIEYDHIFYDQDASRNLVEYIKVSPVIDGLPSEYDYSTNRRGHIRPVPPDLSFVPWEDLRYGTCVDVFYDAAWWEGVIFDHNHGHDKRNVFFPDLGDDIFIIKTEASNVRLTQDWNEVKGTWHCRGIWPFLEVMEVYAQEKILPVSVKQIWYDVREKDAFKRTMKEWTCGDKDLWERLLLETIDENIEIALHDIFPLLDLKDIKVLESSVLLEFPEHTDSKEEGSLD